MNRRSFSLHRAAALLLPVSVLLLVSGCQTTAKQPAHAAAAVNEKATVVHVVLFWLKTPGDDAAVRRIIETSQTFRAIPGVVDLAVGRPIPSTRPVVDSSFDVGLMITFTDEAALNAYETHPIHASAVANTLRPLAAKVQVYDINK